MGELEAQSFRNMVGFHQKGLRAFMGGQPLKSIFNYRLIRNLKRQGILTPKKPKGRSRRRAGYKGGIRLYQVSPEARALLDIALIVLCVVSLP